jgi:transcriptional regulator with XRE-family HTH domain
VDAQDPRLLLAQRLRQLREQWLPARRITQLQVAEALGQVSVPLVSSWESGTNPRLPTPARIEGYAVLFGAARCFEHDPPRLLGLAEMTEDERRSVADLARDLTHLRNEALRATAPAATSPTPSPGPSIEESLANSPLRFSDGNTITIVCGQWPADMLSTMPYTGADDPDYIELMQYSDLDALFELHGHLRAANPANLVNLGIAGKLASDAYHTHLVLLGGVDWNTTASQVLARLQLPVRQIADWSTPDGQFFEAEENGTKVRHRAQLVRRSGKEHATHTEGEADDKGILLEDVALFARAVNPLNRKRTVTICHGMYGRGTYGAVRALTDANFRDRNAEHVRTRFGDSDTYCILMRVPIFDGATLTPDWTTGEHTLFEWPG